MTQVNRVRELFFEKGLTYAEVSRVTGSDVKTVKKYIHREDFNLPPPEASGSRFSKLDRYKKDIDEWLEEDKRVRRKQRHTARRVFECLGEKYGAAFDCSYRLVAGYVAEKKRELYSGEDHFYLPLEHIPGEVQVDFGEADFYEGTTRQSGHYLNVSLSLQQCGLHSTFQARKPAVFTGWYSWRPCLGSRDHDPPADVEAVLAVFDCLKNGLWKTRAGPTLHHHGLRSRWGWWQKRCLSRRSG